MQDFSNKNIVLVGMMGAGKSYIGNKLAKLLSHFNFIDMDKEIEKAQGKTVSEIFEQDSEDKFRELETELIKKYSNEKNLIITTGGGTFQREENIELLKKNGLCYYLKAPATELFNRIKDENKRPLLNCENPQKKLEELLKIREKNYQKADFTIDTLDKKAYTILNDIIQEYERNAKEPIKS